MIKKILLVAIALGLAGCQTQLVVKPKISEFRIPSELLDCGRVMPKIPNYQTLKNKDITKYISNLKRVINECSLDVNSIKNLTEQYNELVKKFNEDNK